MTEGGLLVGPNLERSTPRRMGTPARLFVGNSNADGLSARSSLRFAGQSLFDFDAVNIDGGHPLVAVVPDDDRP